MSHDLPFIISLPYDHIHPATKWRIKTLVAKQWPTNSLVTDQLCHLDIVCFSEYNQGVKMVIVKGYGYVCM